MYGFFQRCQCSLSAWISDVPFQRGRAGDAPGASLGRDAFACASLAAFLRLPVPGNGRAPGGRGPYTGLCGACQRPDAVGRFRRRAPGGVVRSSPSDFSPPLLRSWCGLIGVAAAILAVFGWFYVANIQHLKCTCQVFLQLFLRLFFILLLVRGMENVNFTIFWRGLWFPCWLQSASSRRQGLRVWFSRHTCGVPGY